MRLGHCLATPGNDLSRLWDAGHDEGELFTRDKGDAHDRLLWIGGLLLSTLYGVAFVSLNRARARTK